MDNKHIKDAPYISYLRPDEVEQEWEGFVEIIGNNFDLKSFAMFDGRIPGTGTRYKSTTLLEATVDISVTGTPRTKTVKVHTGAGDVSNEVHFLVRAKQS